MKNIVICCDGTGNQFGRDNTNAVKLHSMLKFNATQVTYYNRGVGTFSIRPALVRPIESFNKTVSLALGAGLKHIVCEAYEFLVSNFEEGDRVYLFGFSRGAYTVRVVAAMIKAFGVLRSANAHLVSDALQLLEFKETLDFQVVNGFKRQFSTGLSPSFCFVGVWDTVASVSWAWERLKYSYTRTNTAVDVVRHAVSMDERRSLFHPNLWGNQQANQDAKKVWFSGVHSDVGGGYARNESGLSNIALEWMLTEAKVHGLQIDDQRAAKILRDECPPNHTSQAHESLTPSWWPLEFFPKGMRMNLFRRRQVRTLNKDTEVRLHESLVKRMKDATVSYQPSNLPQSYQIESWMPYQFEAN